MNYNFNDAMKTFAATGAKETKKESKYQMVYPNEGKLLFRPLFNPASNQFYRLINRHKIEGRNVTCLATYGGKKDEVCPICQMLKNVENAGIQFPREYGSKVRAILFAQFVSADYEVAGGKLNKGDIFLLMVPYTVYNQYHKWLADYMDDNGAGLAKLVGSADGPVCIIEKGKDPTDWQFRQHPSQRIATCDSDEEWCKVLDGIENLYEQCGCHTEMSQNDVDNANAMAEAINNAFFAGDRSKLTELTTYTPKNSQPTQQAAPVVEVAQPTYTAPVQQTMFTQPAQPAQPVQQANTGMPACYGTYTADGEDRAKVMRCKFCPQQMVCKTATSNGNIPF